MSQAAPCEALLRPLPDVHRCGPGDRPGQVAVAQFIGSDRIDRPLLLDADPIGIGARLDLVDDHLRGFVDGVCTEQREAALDDSLVFFSGPAHAAVRGEFWNALGDLDLNEVAVRGEYIDALRGRS